MIRSMNEESSEEALTKTVGEGVGRDRRIEGLTIHSPKTMLVTEPRSERFDHFKSLWKGSAKLFYARVALD